MNRIQLFAQFCIITIFIICCDSHNSSGSDLGYHELVGIRRAQQIRFNELTWSRIIGGTLAQLAEIPYQAGIVITLTNGATSICGGSLISNTRIVTAAHCWWDGVSQAKEFVVVLGSLTIFSGGTRIKTSDVLVHSSWNPNDVVNDIMIAKITSVPFTNNIKAIALPTTATQDYSGVSATVSGYGKTSDAQTTYPTNTALYKRTLTIITNAECQKSFEVTIQNHYLCTSGVGGVGTCEGDSGGPLVVKQNNKDILVGVVSFGFGDSCQRGYPSVFTRVTSYLTWIKSNS